ncbi:MAG: hypothetical protein ABL932_16425 [Terricaulis sp.]
MRLLVLLSAAFVLLGAPLALARDFDPALINALRPGITTQEDVVELLGEPDSRAPSLNDHTGMIYEYDIVPNGESVAGHYMFVLLFDPQGNFVRLQVYRDDRENGSGN